MRRPPENLWQVAGIGLLGLCAQQAIADDAAAAAGPPAYPEYADESLAAGRKVWLGTCEGCHGYGIAGSPKIGDVEAWVPRIAQGKDSLYTHALKGFFGRGSTYMPPRGGNDELTDDEVRAAVDYMVAASSGDPGATK